MKRLFEGEELQASKKSGGQRSARWEVSSVLAENLPKSYNQAKVRKFFQDCGSIREVDVVDSLDKNNRLARIQFDRHDEALTALTKTYKRIGQNEITVSLLEDCTIWLTNFPPSYTARNIKELLNNVKAVVLSVRLPSLRYDSNRRFAYVDVSSQEEVATVVDIINGKNIEGYKLVAKKSNPLEKVQRTDHGAAERREIMVRQLDTNQLTEEYLRRHFSEFGAIELITIPVDHTRSTKGYAFITFEDLTAAQAATQVETLEGKQVEIRLANRKAYVERQKVKTILNSRSNDDRIVALYPLNDKVSKVQIETLLTHKMAIGKDSINEVLLVTDRKAALICFKEPVLAAKCIISLNGIEHLGRILHCGTVGDLRKQKNDKSQDHVSYSSHQPSDKSGLHAHKDGQKLSNSDFRKMFLGK